MASCRHTNPFPPQKYTQNPCREYQTISYCFFEGVQHSENTCFLNPYYIRPLTVIVTRLCCDHYTPSPVTRPARGRGHRRRRVRQRGVRRAERRHAPGGRVPRRTRYARALIGTCFFLRCWIWRHAIFSVLSLFLGGAHLLFCHSFCFGCADMLVCLHQHLSLSLTATHTLSVDSPSLSSSRSQPDAPSRGAVRFVFCRTRGHARNDTLFRDARRRHVHGAAAQSPVARYVQYANGGGLCTSTSFSNNANAKLVYSL